MLKKLERLAELDSAIDGWLRKLHEAEDRRICVQHRLLEHVAVALTHKAAEGGGGGSGDPNPMPPTPPQSPENLGRPLQTEKTEGERISFCADSEVRALLMDIDREIEAMVQNGSV